MPKTEVPNSSGPVPPFLVWVCAGCDDCAPSDGRSRSAIPCDGPSKNGMWVVPVEVTDEMVERLARHLCGIPADVDFEHLKPTAEALARAREHIEIAHGVAAFSTQEVRDA